MSFNFSPRIVRDGLVLYLDAVNTKSYVSGATTWFDLSTGLNDATIIGTSFNNSNYGNIIFDGTDDYAKVAENPNLYFTGTSPYTLSVFANITTSISTPPAFINRENSSLVFPRNGYNFWFYRDSLAQVAIASERWTGDGVQKVTYILLNNSECINVWNQYTVTYDGTTLRFYLNGELKHSASASGSITNTSTRLEIGKLNTYYGNFKLSNAMVYSKALSQAEVAQNYNTLKNRFRL